MSATDVKGPKLDDIREYLLVLDKNEFLLKEQKNTKTVAHDFLFNDKTILHYARYGKTISSRHESFVYVLN